MSLDYEKIIVELIEHFIDSEGTDYLGDKDEPEGEFVFKNLDLEHRTELARLRDIARKRTGWHGYD